MRKYNLSLSLAFQYLICDFEFQAEAEQRPHKVSFYVDKVEATEIMNVLSQRLAKRGVSSPLVF